MPHGLLISNLGTPKSTKRADISGYLHQFLMDKRVIDLPWFFRFLLVYGFIVPFRTKKSAHAYQSIWTNQGSPLLIHSKNLLEQLQKALGSDYKVALGMRYGQPSIKEAIAELSDCESMTILPLYPQYSSAATGSSLEEIIRILAQKAVIPSFRVIRDFYQHPAYLKAQANIIKNHMDNAEHLLLSYHGIPERQIYKSGCETVCPGACPTITEKNQGCYKAQCFQTSFLLATELHLNPEQYSTAFQSRLGKTPWIKPFTDEILSSLASKGIKKLAISCPSFVADCLETIEEIGLRAKAQWLELGGEQLILIPCLNTDPVWIDALACMIKEIK